MSPAPRGRVFRLFESTPIAWRSRAIRRTAWSAYGQVGTAELSGTVSDPSGAAVVNAKVTAVNAATNFERSTTTNNNGNVLTHTDHRGRGYAQAVTSAVTAELLRYCDQVVLNVRSDNPPAIQAYLRLGYTEHTRFEERLIRRTTSPWADLTAPLRRLFSRGSRQEADASATRNAVQHARGPANHDQAHPSDPSDPPSADGPPEEPR